MPRAPVIVPVYETLSAVLEIGGLDAQSRDQDGAVLYIFGHAEKAEDLLLGGITAVRVVE